MIEMKGSVGESGRCSLRQVYLQGLEAVSKGVVVPGYDQHIHYAVVPKDGPHCFECRIGNPVLAQQFNHKLDDGRVLGI